MNTPIKTSAPGAGALIRIPLSQLVSQDDLKVRGDHLSEQHVHELRQAIRRGSKLPPVLVWQQS